MFDVFSGFFMALFRDAEVDQVIAALQRRFYPN
jgi:hypothetical protein